MTHYSASTAIRVTGVTQRNLEYWDQAGIVVPSVPAAGTGRPRRYSFQDLVRLSVVRRLRKAGLSLQHIQKGIAKLRAKGEGDPLSGTVLLASGGTLLRRLDKTSLEDVLADGQLVFSVIATGRIEEETRAGIARVERESAARKKAHAG